MCLALAKGTAYIPAFHATSHSRSAVALVPSDTRCSYHLDRAAVCAGLVEGQIGVWTWSRNVRTDSHLGCERLPRHQTWYCVCLWSTAFSIGLGHPRRPMAAVQLWGQLLCSAGTGSVQVPACGIRVLSGVFCSARDLVHLRNGYKLGSPWERDVLALPG